MINTEKTVLSPRIERKIEQLHQDKIRICRSVEEVN